MSDESNLQTPDGKANPIDTDYQVGQDNVALQIGPFGLDIHNRVFLIAGLTVVAFVFSYLSVSKPSGAVVQRYAHVAYYEFRLVLYECR